jgi:hypothetical protein
VNQRLDRLDHLAPFLREPALAYIQTVQEKCAIALAVVFTWRSVQEQSAIYQKGRTYDPGQGIWVVTDETAVVTNAKPGLSAHNVVDLTGKPAAMGMDVMPLKADGTLDWVAAPAFWAPLYELAWRYGFDPLGDSIGAYLPGDWGHLEEPAWRRKLSGLGLVQPVSPTQV